MHKQVDQIEDKLLWEQTKAGNQNSFALIFKSHYSALYAYGVKMVPFPDYVRDQIQNLFLNIWQTRERLGTVSNLKAYLLISLRRQLLVSKKNNFGTESLDEYAVNNTNTLYFESDEFVNKYEISSEIKKCLLANLNALPPKQREIIFLRFYHKLTYSEIADIIDVKEQSVKNSMPKIFEKLRRGLSGFKREDLKDVDIFLFEFFLLFTKKI